LLTSRPANLDSHTGETILKLFHDLSQKGRTIALVTHDPEIAAVTPRKIEIRDGKIAENVDAKLAGAQDGTEVFSKPGARNMRAQIRWRARLPPSHERVRCEN
jgi:energy-coupling factor transporter ATP-binding protein EcfA2